MNMNEHEQRQSEEEFAYDREPPLDRDTTRMNQGRSKYVFMTLCFLVALVLFYIHLTGTFSSDTSENWFPLVGAIVLAIAGLGFLLSPGSKSEEPEPTLTTLATSPATDEMPLSQFEQLIQEALSAIPAEFHTQMDNIIVRAAYEPDEEVLRRMNVKEGHTLLGLYEGVPLTAYGHASYPEVITIYQRPIEAYCQHDPERIRTQVRATVLHEVAHHFGMGHEEMPIWVK